MSYMFQRCKKKKKPLTPNASCKCTPIRNHVRNLKLNVSTLTRIINLYKNEFDLQIKTCKFENLNIYILLPAFGIYFLTSAKYMFFVITLTRLVSIIHKTFP